MLRRTMLVTAAAISMLASATGRADFVSDMEEWTFESSLISLEHPQALESSLATEAAEGVEGAAAVAAGPYSCDYTEGGWIHQHPMGRNAVVLFGDTVEVTPAQRAREYTAAQISCEDSHHIVTTDFTLSASVVLEKFYDSTSACGSTSANPYYPRPCWKPTTLERACPQTASSTAGFATLTCANLLEHPATPITGNLRICWYLTSPINVSADTATKKYRTADDHAGAWGCEVVQQSLPEIPSIS